LARRSIAWERTSVSPATPQTYIAGAPMSTQCLISSASFCSDWPTAGWMLGMMRSLPPRSRLYFCTSAAPLSKTVLMPHCSASWKV